MGFTCARGSGGFEGFHLGFSLFGLSLGRRRRNVFDSFAKIRQDLISFTSSICWLLKDILDQSCGLREISKNVTVVL